MKNVKWDSEHVLENIILHLASVITGIGRLLRGSLTARSHTILALSIA
jgi:hypothetical protein